MAFRSTVTRPVETALEVMSGLGFATNEEDVAAFQAYVEVNRDERRGAHSYTAADFGLSEERLRADFASYEERYVSRRGGH